MQRPLFEQVLTGAKTLELEEINSHQTSSRVSGTVSAGSNNSCHPILSTTLCQEHFICNISFNPHHHPRNCSRRKLRFKRLATPEGTQGATQWQRQDSAQPGLWGQCWVNRMLTPHRRGRGFWRRDWGVGALSGSWTTMPFPPPELWKQQARMQRPVARGPCDMLLSFQKCITWCFQSITWCFLVSSVCPHVLRYKPSETVRHRSFLLFWCPCCASHPAGRVWALCSLWQEGGPASSPGLGHWGPLLHCLCGQLVGLRGMEVQMPSGGQKVHLSCSSSWSHRLRDTPRKAPAGAPLARLLTRILLSLATWAFLGGQPP